MYRLKLTSVFLLAILFFTGCKKKNVSEESDAEDPAETVIDIRIEWDYNTLKQISADNDARYNGYARMVQLTDLSLICVYETDGKIVTVKSVDQGDSWSQPTVVAEKEEGVNMAAPDILVLNDQSILVCYNPRPYDIDPSRNFGIRTKKSYDKGLTWEDERIVYQAGYKFENGCWEPSAIQLPDGEIQLFFADESIYETSSEQNISLMRSHDNGLAWTKDPEIVSFRADARDGMPSPLLLNNEKDIVVAIEDNGLKNFKPYILKNTIEDNWENTIGANNEGRKYALKNKIEDELYAGAPYLAQLATGETILSYQGTEGRENNMNTAEMKVVIGTSDASGFDQKTKPFIIPSDKSCLWNSIAVLKDNTVVALTSTNAYGKEGITEVWMIKGNVVSK